MSELERHRGEMSELGERFSAVAEQYPEAFAGLENHDGSFVLHVAGPAVELLAAVRSTPALRGVEIEVVHEERSYADLEGLTERLSTADERELSAHGVSLVEWGPNIVTNTVEVHLEDYSASAAQWLEARFGPGVSVARQSMARPRELRWDLRADGPPSGTHVQGGHLGQS